MIDEIQVENIALIAHASLSFSPGLTVITGETGSGKSALLSALGLLTGERADALMVRAHTDELRVSGRFYFKDEPDPEIVDEYDASEGVIVDRRVSAAGKSRAHINGRVASLRDISALFNRRVAIVSQHQYHELLSNKTHRATLDTYADIAETEEFRAYRTAYDAWRAAIKARDELIASSEMSPDALEEARFTLRRIDEVHPIEGEYDELKERVERFEHAQAIHLALGGAREALSGDGGTLDSLGSAVSALQSVSDHLDDESANALSALIEATYIVEDAARELRSAHDALEDGAANLDEMQERLLTLQGLMRSYGPTMAAVFETRENMAARIHAHDSFEEEFERVSCEVDRAFEALSLAAHALHEARVAHAQAFEQAVCAQMKRLDLKGAMLSVSVEFLDRSAWSVHGADAVEFMFCPDASMNPRPLAKIASGGEMSRVLLAMSVVMGEKDTTETIVFDEIDAGVGGQTARTLSEVIYDLSRTHQVIVVTHLAQLALFGDTHYVIARSATDPTNTVIDTREGDARIDELARMLSGSSDDAARHHAQVLLDEVEALKRSML